MEKLLRNAKYPLIVSIALIMIYAFSNQYTNIRDVIGEKYRNQQELVEKNILQTVNYVNDAYQIAEQQLNREMRTYSQEMVAKYRVEPDVMEWDLPELQERFQGYDIYIVDRDLTIIKTTYQEDLGLDFSTFGSFATILRERMEGDTFEVDRLDLSTQAGVIKKYSYMPSPDNRYLFELSVSIEDRYPSFQSLNLFKDATSLTQEYDLVDDIGFYSVEPLNYGVAKLRNSKRPYLNPDVPEFEEEAARQAVITGDIQRSTRTTDDIQRSYRFFPALVADHVNEQGWNSYVVGIIYNDQVMREEIADHRRLFMINVVSMAVLFAGFIGVVVYLLQRFEHQAHHDKLTGLANRKFFTESFIRLKKKADANGECLGVVFIDIDRFKEINDRYGHDTGDAVLKSIASRMENHLKEKDLKARIGGDEFVIALADLSSKDDITDVAVRLIADLRKPLSVDGLEIPVGVSAGFSVYPNDSDELDELISAADMAMYEEKRQR